MRPIIPEELQSTFDEAEDFDRFGESGRQGVLRREVLAENVESWTGYADGYPICYDSRRQVSPC